MASGYDKGFILEHDPTRHTRMKCSDCIYYCADDKSCSKKPFYLPEDGYDSWRYCEYCCLNPDADNYSSKKGQLDNWRRRNFQYYDKTNSCHTESNRKKPAHDLGREQRMTKYQHDKQNYTSRLAHDGSYIGAYTMYPYMRDCPFCGSRLKELACSYCGAIFIVTTDRSENRLKQACKDGVFLIYKDEGKKPEISIAKNNVEKSKLLKEMASRKKKTKRRKSA